METIPKAGCRQVGYFRKTHGVHGELVLEFGPEFELSVSETERYFIELEGLLVPFFIQDDGFRFKSSKSAIVKFNWVDSESYARRLVGCPVYLYAEEIRDSEEESPLSLFVDFLLEDEKTGPVGMITGADNFSGNIVLNVIHKGNELLIPFNDDLLVSVNHEQKILTLRVPKGLIDL